MLSLTGTRKLFKRNIFVATMSAGSPSSYRSIPRPFRVDDFQVLAAADSALEAAGFGG
jgi:hypothetical protein